ncbi:TPA: ead/Ea22-like family protein [Escherichia coli]|nr:ead/Ea22-like family protein [Escherichia coli]
MNKIDYQALREKAEKATCGVWSLEYGESRFDCDDALIHRDVVGYLPICRIEGAHPESGFDEDFQMEQQANAEFIAAANPATVLSLLGELETAKKRIAELEAEPVSQTCKLPVNTPCQDAPAHIWLQTAGVWPEDGELSELTWCSHNQHHDDTLYVRADLVNGNSPVTPDGWVMVPKELTPEMMRAVQIRSELGGYATSNLSGAYNMFSEFWNVAVSAAPKVDDL